MPVCKKDERSCNEIMHGTEFCGLRINEMQGGAALIRMQKGVRFPRHNHKSGEQATVPSLHIARRRYKLLSNGKNINGLDGFIEEAGGYSLYLNETRKNTG